MSQFAIVNTDNFGSDYPDERFVGDPFDTREQAQVEADRLNGPDSVANFAPRFNMVVQLPYKLKPGFEP